MSWGTYIAVFAVMVVGSTVQSSVGMGQGLIAAPLLRLLHPDLLPGPIVFAAIFTTIVLVARNSQRSDIPEVLPAVFGRVIGIIGALILLATLSERGLTLAIGFLVLMLVGLRVGGVKVARTAKTLVGAGIASGVGGGIAALGGAPMGLLYEQDSQARDFRGPMGVFQLAGSCLTIGALAVAGVLDGEGILLGLALLPPIAVGWVLAVWVTPVVDRGFMRPIILVLSAGSATVLILGELF